MEFAQPARPRRKPSLTPMIDVVFLLLVFFMLASRFGIDAVIPLPLAASGGDYTGPPRLITITPETIQLNGHPIADLVTALTPLMATPDDTLIIRGLDGATLQRIVDVSGTLKAVGFTSLILVE